MSSRGSTAGPSAKLAGKNNRRVSTQVAKAPTKTTTKPPHVLEVRTPPPCAPRRHARRAAMRADSNAGGIPVMAGRWHLPNNFARVARWRQFDGLHPCCGGTVCIPVAAAPGGLHACCGGTARAQVRQGQLPLPPSRRRAAGAATAESNLDDGLMMATMMATMMTWLID
eukprot:2613021-Prymnesium_polylepis.1